MLWPVERGEEVPVGWSYWCFLQDRGRIFGFQREGRFLFWAYPLPSVWLRVENVLTCGEIGVEAFFFTSAVLWWAGRLAAHACPLQSEQTQSRGLIREGMMCTLPSEGVSFCLSAAAKSLLNKKADVKVSPLVSSHPHVPSHCPSLLNVLCCESFTQNRTYKTRCNCGIFNWNLLVLVWFGLVLVLRPNVLKVTAVEILSRLLSL